MRAKVTADLSTRLELALMGKVIPIHEDSEVQKAFEYICSATSHDPKSYEGGNDVLNNRIRQYTKTNDVAFICTNTIYGRPCIVFILQSRATGDEKYPDPFVEDYGCGYPCAFVYCMNLADDQMCSEFGDAFFKKHPDGYYHRVS